MNKASGGDGIPTQLFQILKDDAVKVLHSICQQIWKTQQWPKTVKDQFSFEGQCQRMFKLLFTIALISNCSKIMLKVLQARLQQYMNCELPDVPAGFRKGIEEPENKLPTSVGSSKKQKSSRKTSTSALLTTPKPLTVWKWKSLSLVRLFETP